MDINYTSISMLLLLFLVLIRYGFPKLQIMDGFCPIHGMILPFIYPTSYHGTFSKFIMSFARAIEQQKFRL